MVSVLTAVSKKKRTNNGVPLELLSEWAETRKQTAQQTLSVLDGVSAMEKGKAEKGHGVQGGAGWGSGSILSKGDRHSPAPHREGSTCATAQRGGVHTMYREDGTEKWMNTEALALAGPRLECSRSARMPAWLGVETEEAVRRRGQAGHGDRHAGPAGPSADGSFHSEGDGAHGELCYRRMTCSIWCFEATWRIKCREQIQEETRSPLEGEWWPEPGVWWAGEMWADWRCILKVEPIEFSDQLNAGCNSEFTSITE